QIGPGADDSALHQAHGPLGTSSSHDPVPHHRRTRIDAEYGDRAGGNQVPASSSSTASTSRFVKTFDTSSSSSSASISCNSFRASAGASFTRLFGTIAISDDSG